MQANGGNGRCRAAGARILAGLPAPCCVRPGPDHPQQRDSRQLQGSRFGEFRLFAVFSPPDSSYGGN